MAVSLPSFDFLWIESIPVFQDVTRELGLENNIESETIFRVEKHGYNVGFGLAHVLTRNHDRYLNTDLDIMRYIGKELWTLLFGGIIGTLKTNHLDTYVLEDKNFIMCQRMSTSLSLEETVRQATPYLWFPAGLIRGFLEGMGIKSKVTFDASKLPSVEFSIVILDY